MKLIEIQEDDYLAAAQHWIKTNVSRHSPTFNAAFDKAVIRGAKKHVVDVSKFTGLNGKHITFVQKSDHNDDDDDESLAPPKVFQKPPFRYISNSGLSIQEYDMPTQVINELKSWLAPVNYLAIDCKKGRIGDIHYSAIEGLCDRFSLWVEADKCGKIFDIFRLPSAYVVLRKNAMWDLVINTSSDDHPGKIEVERNHGDTRSEEYLDSVFELQDWLIENGYEGIV